MTDKAKEYAEQIMTRLKPAAFHGRDVLIMDPEDAKTLVSIAYRAEIRKTSFGPVKFCWECGKRLRGRFSYQIKVQSEWRTVHKSCSEKRGSDE